MISIIGILKSGCAYIPVDTTWPAHRIEQILTKSSAGLILTNNLNLGQAKAFSRRCQILNTEEPEEASEVFTNQSGPDDIIHILFTSGSSGEPKGVYTDHQSQAHFVKRLSEFLEISPSDRFAYHFSIGFSAHAMPLLGILLNGGTLCMYDLKKKGFQGLASFYLEQEISLALMIPSVLRHFRMTLTKGMKLKHIRALLIGGETLYYNDIKLIQPYLKRQTEIINIYASTEAFLARAYRMINSEAVLKQNIIPIGYEIDGMEINILDEEGQICEPQQIGEMIIKSPYLAKGYWNDTENTERDFSHEGGMITFRSKDLAYTLADGAIVHVGRKDSMVKIADNGSTWERSRTFYYPIKSRKLLP